MVDRTAAGAPDICWHREEGGGDARPEAAAAVHLYMDTVANQCSDGTAPPEQARLGSTSATEAIRGLRAAG